MDLIHPHRQQNQGAIFGKVTELFSLPLSLVFNDLTSAHFEGDGVSPPGRIRLHLARPSRRPRLEGDGRSPRE
jgi:hypothetical protein